MKPILFVSIRCFVLALVVLIITPSSRGDNESYQREIAIAVRAAANHVLPSVVSVEVIGTSGSKDGEVEQDAPTSGVIVDEAGYVLASSLVTARSSATLLVVLPDGSRNVATVIAEDHHRDLVLLKIQTDVPLTPIELPQDSTTLANRPIGSTLISIGRYGPELSPMISIGIFSAKDRLDGIAIQTDARVSPTMYGGPLVDLYGNVLGILIPAVAEGGAETSTSWYDSGIAFAIPTDVIAKKIGRLKQGNDIKKGLLGIVPGSRDMNASDTTIAAVRTRSPADQTGIKPGDKVVSLQQINVRRFQEIRQVLGAHDAGETIHMRILRKVDSKEQELDFEIVLTDTIPPLTPQRLGVVVSAQTSPNLKSTDEKKTAVIVDAIVPSSAADGLLDKGDQIVRIADSEVGTILNLRRQLIAMEPDTTISVEVIRDDQPVTLQLEPQSIEGHFGGKVPVSWSAEHTEESPPWKTTSIKLPNAANEAAFTMPEERVPRKSLGEEVDEDSDPEDKASTLEDVNAPARRLGLMILLLEPDNSTPMEVAKAWQDVAAESGVVVCVIASEDPARWQPKELATIAEFAKAIQKKATIDSASVAVGSLSAIAGENSSVADSMALAVAISQSEVFHGVAVSHHSRTPAVRLRENEPTNSLQLLMPAESEDSLPTWAPALKKSGYPILWDGEIDQSALLHWVRLLHSI